MSLLLVRRRLRGTIAELAGAILTVCLLTSTGFGPHAANAGNTTPQGQEKKVSVWLKVDGTKRPITTTSQSVGALLQAAAVTLNSLDRVYPSKNTPLKAGMVVTVVRISMQTIEKAFSLPCNTSYQLSKELRPGIQRVIQEGSEGVGVRVVRVWRKDGKITERQVIGTRVQKKPVARIVMMGDRTLTLSRGGMRPRKVLWLEATGYSPDPRSCGKHATGYTSIGLRAGYGVVAVDPRVIPLGTRLFIEGYGYAVAADVGGAIKGMRIDLGHDTHLRALQVGRRKVRVYVLD